MPSETRLARPHSKVPRSPPRTPATGSTRNRRTLRGQGGRNRVRGLSYFLTLWCIGMLFGDSFQVNSVKIFRTDYDSPAEKRRCGSRTASPSMIWRFSSKSTEQWLAGIPSELSEIRRSRLQ
jgi:hypothetical protein